MQARRALCTAPASVPGLVTDGIGDVLDVVRYLPPPPELAACVETKLEVVGGFIGINILAILQSKLETRPRCD